MAVVCWHVGAVFGPVSLPWRRLPPIWGSIKFGPIASAPSFAGGCSVIWVRLRPIFAVAGGIDPMATARQPINRSGDQGGITGGRCCSRMRDGHVRRMLR